MIKRASYVIAVVSLTAAVFAGACASGANNSAKNAATEEIVQKAVAAAPTRGMLSDLEARTFEASKNGERELLQEMLADQFVSYHNGERRDKAGEIAFSSENKCTVNKRSVSDETMVPVGTDAVVLTARVETDALCGERKVPSPSVVSTLFIRIGSDWKVAYRNEVAAGSGSADGKTSGAATAAPPVASSNPGAEEAVTSAEQAIRAAIKSRSAPELAERLTEDVTLVDRFGNVSIGKEAVVKTLTGGQCQITRSEVASPSGTQLSRMVSLLTYRVENEGKCDGRPLAPVWGTSIYQRMARDWKVAYIFETPAR